MVYQENNSMVKNEAKIWTLWSKHNENKIEKKGGRGKQGGLLHSEVNCVKTAN